MNFKHLHYFWSVAKAGGVVKAGAQLHTSPQTLSGQIKLLEQRLGRNLFRKSGRKLELTDDGRLALRYADDIFSLGSELEAVLRQERGVSQREQVLEFHVGVEDAVAKTVVYRLLEAALNLPEPVRLVCVEGPFSHLMAQLALHKLDLVLADEPLTNRLSIKGFNHALGSSPISFFCAPQLRQQLQGPFPDCLNGAPMLIPGAASTLRLQFEAWLTRHQLHPRVVGEFDDGALMKAFGQQGRGVFLSPTVVDEETIDQLGVELVGRSHEMVEEFFAISVERRIKHPCVVAISQAAKNDLFSRRAAAIPQTAAV
jgi:LysR family transcriptional regulator, transcriptional activator of nhaA